MPKSKRSPSRRQDGLSRGTAGGFLLTLEALGYVRSDGKTFRLAPKTLNLGYAYLSSLPLWKMAQPIMKEVVERSTNRARSACSTSTTSSISRGFRRSICPSSRSNLGTRMPAHINAMGQVLLAEFQPQRARRLFRNAKFEKITRYTPTSEAAIRKALASVAKDGYALSDQQLQLGLLSIAVPVPVKSGRPEVAMNVSAEDHRVTKRELVRRFLPILRRAADQVAHAL